MQMKIGTIFVRIIFASNVVSVLSWIYCKVYFGD